ncbi:hypothetical protein, partial [Psychrobacter sp. GW64-MNA-CIBAN-0177]|uniref:hypothetical protein n=1 Tax=Psychrobacter sp. GW64-MNA-CIBAN-0177 TaxID=3140449 RepID=UPI003326AB0E
RFHCVISRLRAVLWPNDGIARRLVAPERILTRYFACTSILAPVPLRLSFSGRSGCMIAGSMVALVTPMDAQGRLDWDSLGKLV